MERDHHHGKSHIEVMHTHSLGKNILSTVNITRCPHRVPYLILLKCSVPEQMNTVLYPGNLVPQPNDYPLQ